MRLIDADVLREDLRKFFSTEVLEGIESKVLFAQIMHDIDNAPTVEERPQGEWIVTAEDNEGVHRILCPFCGYEKGTDFIDYITVTFERMPPFCENCGTDMRGKEE